MEFKEIILIGDQSYERLNLISRAGQPKLTFVTNNDVD